MCEETRLTQGESHKGKDERERGGGGGGVGWHILENSPIYTYIKGDAVNMVIKHCRFNTNFS